MPKTEPKIRPCYLIAVSADNGRGFRLTDQPPLPDADPGQSVEHTLWVQDPIRLVNFAVANGWTPLDLLVGDRAVVFYATKDRSHWFQPGGVTYAIESSPLLEIWPPVSIKLRLRNDSGTPQRPRDPSLLMDLRDRDTPLSGASMSAGPV